MIILFARKAKFIVWVMSLVRRMARTAFCARKFGIVSFPRFYSFKFSKSNFHILTFPVDADQKFQSRDIALQGFIKDDIRIEPDSRTEFVPALVETEQLGKQYAHDLDLIQHSREVYSVYSGLDDVRKMN